MIDELRLGPTQSERDKELAHGETQDKINELIRQLNEDPTFYTKVEVDAIIAGLDLSGDPADLSAYITAEEIAALYATIEQLENKANLVHDHDTRYYTETEINNMRTIPFFNADGSSDPIPLTSSGAVPFYNADGSFDPVPLQA